MKSVKRTMVGLIAAAALLLGLAACSDSEPASAGNKVLFVGRDSGGDAIVAKRLREVHGMEVTVVADKELTVEHANGCALIYISETVNSGRIGDKFVSTPIPVIYAEPQSTSDTGMTVTEGYGKLESGNAAKTIQIKDGQHPLAAGLTGKIDVYKDNGKMGYAVPGEEAIVVATVPDDDQKATIFAYEKGAKNAKDMTIPARVLYFYLFEGEEINQSEDGWKLFDAAVKWVTGKI